MYSPDPYVTVRLLGTPNPIQKTKHISKTCDPEWNETFQFYMDPKKDQVIGKLTLLFLAKRMPIFWMAGRNMLDGIIVCQKN